jgi:hypothetical protein
MRKDPAVIYAWKACSQTRGGQASVAPSTTDDAQGPRQKALHEAQAGGGKPGCETQLQQLAQRRPRTVMLERL